MEIYSRSRFRFSVIDFRNAHASTALTAAAALTATESAERPVC